MMLSRKLHCTRLNIVVNLLDLTNYSGTEKQYVAYDYATRLHIGQVECETLIADVAGAYASNKSGAPPPKFHSCEYLNISICPTTEQGNVHMS